MLTIRESLVDGMLNADAMHLHDLFEGPTLFHLKGRRKSALFVAVLLHGNEDTSWLAIREILRKYRVTPLPRSLSLFVGNVAAARDNVRMLPGQPDYNRIWDDVPGTEDMPERKMMRQVVEEMKQRGVFAIIDIHNNTGVNPHYACVRRLENQALHLATLFSRTVVYFLSPAGVQVEAFADLCPSVTLECGQPGESHGTEHAFDYIDACLHIRDLPEHPVPPHDIDVFKTVATVKVPQDLSFGFGLADADIRFVDNLDHLNFRELPANTALGWIRPGSNARLDVRDDDGEEVGERYFRLNDGEIRTILPLMPSMLTLNTDAIRQDCLCYLMERQGSVHSEEQAQTPAISKDQG